MVRPASKLLLKFLAATAISAALLAGLFGFKLLAGPISLSLLQPLVEAVLNGDLSQYRVSLGETELAWSRADRKLDLRVKDAKLKTLDGETIAVVPEMSVAFSRAALARGRLVPGTVALIGPSATLVRRQDGGFQLGFSAPGADPGADHVVERSADFFARLVAGLRGEAGDNERLGFLNGFIIKDANLTFYDAATRSTWRAPHSLVTFTRTRDGLQAQLAAGVQTGKSDFKIIGAAMLPHGGADTTVTLSLAGLDPSALAATPGSPLAIWSGVHVPVRGDASLRINVTGRIEEGAFWLFAGAGPFVMPGLPSMAADLTSAEIKGTYNGARDEVALERLSYRGSGNTGYVTGKAVLDRAPDGGIAAADFDLSAKDLVLDLPALFSEPGRIERAVIRGRIDPGAMHLAIAMAELHAGNAVLALKGEVDDHPEGIGLHLDGTIDRFAFSQFAKLWPLGPGRGARDWIVANVPSGTIRSGVLKVDAKPGDLALDKLPEKAVQLGFDFDGLSIDYLHGLTPITDGHGHARLTGNRFELALESGRIGPLGLSEGHYIVPDLSDKEVPADIGLRIKGETKALLAVLDMSPLGYPTSYGFNPGDVGGASDARLGLTLPMKKTVRFADIGLKAALDATGFTMPALYRKLGIEDGTVHASITNDMLRAQGDVRIAGVAAKVSWTESFNAVNTSSTHLALSGVLDDAARADAGLPFAEDFRGRTPFSLALEGHAKAISRVVIDCDAGPAAAKIPDLAWSKPAGAPASLHADLRLPPDGRVLIQDLALQGSGLDIKGKAAFGADGSLASADLNPLRAGPGTNARLAVTREGKDTRVIAIEGAALDLSQSVSGLTDAIKKPAPEDAAHAPLRLTANLGKLSLAHGIVLTDLDGRYATPGHGISDLSLKAGYADGGFVSARIETVGAARWLRLRSADTGKLLTGLDLTDHVVGGSLILDASLPQASVAPTKEPVKGSFSLKSFRVKRAPALAKLLTVASFGGIRDLLTGDGIAFESLDTPFTMDDSGIILGPGKAFGPSIGLTLQGDVARGSGDLDLSGTLVPAYALNSFLGNVPVIGNIFVSREGEGVIGLTYSIKGDSGDPRVMVNPLSALAPGFLRRIFQLDESNAADRTSALPAAKAPE